MVRVVADLGGQVERDAETGDTPRQEVAVAAIRLRGGTEPGVLPHRPRPAAVHFRLDSPGERERPWSAKVAVVVEARDVLRRGERTGSAARAHGSGDSTVGLLTPGRC